MPAAGLAAALLLLLPASGPEETEENAAASRQPPVASRPDRLPWRGRWTFETTDSAGRELYDMAEVPLFLGGRLTQPDWVQKFGARADPRQRDRFPREPAAVLSTSNPQEGRRSLHLRSRGDHTLVRLRRPVAVAGGLELRLAGHVRLRGLREGSLRLRVSFQGKDRTEGEGLLESPPLRGECGWRQVEVRGSVPDGACLASIEVLLLGSYSDGDAEAWVDALDLDLVAGLRIDWHGRRLLLFSEDEREVPLSVEARGLAPGVYWLEAELGRLSLFEPGPLPAPRRGRVRRHVSTRPGEAATVLRFRGELRGLVGLDSLEPGLHRLTFRIGGPVLARDGEGRSRDGEGQVEESTRIAVLRSAAPGTGVRGLRLGWALREDDLREGVLDLVPWLPAGFPLHELLREVEPGAGEERALDSPAARPGAPFLTAGRPGLPWRSVVDGSAAIACVPRGGGELEEARALSTLLLELASNGRRTAFLRGPGDLLCQHDRSGSASPRAAALVWAWLGRLLASGPARDLSWDPRGRFVAIDQGASHLLVAMSLSGEPFRLSRRTGRPLEGEDLLGRPVAATFDASSGETRLLVLPEPVAYRGFDPGLAAAGELEAQGRTVPHAPPSESLDPISRTRTRSRSRTRSRPPSRSWPRLRVPA